MKTLYQIPGGPEVQGDSTKIGTYVVHKSLGSRKGYCVTLVATGELALWARTVVEAKAARKEIEAGEPVQAVISKYALSQPQDEEGGNGDAKVQDDRDGSGDIPADRS